MNISLEFSYPEYIILGLIVLFSIILIVWHSRRFNRVAKACTETFPEGNTENLDPASIIVYTCNDIENLKKTLPVFLSQEYPEYEVIVVDASHTEATKDFLLEMSFKYKNLYSTFIPNDTLNLSRKKLSLTLGIKAAKHDIIITTASNCMPASKLWLKGIMSRFKKGTDIIIGYSYPEKGADKHLGKYYRSFDKVFTDVQFLSYALHGLTYRGDGNNLAYRKNLFFGHKGFSQSLNLNYGDDDLFINEIATKKNVAVAIGKNCQMKVFYYDYSHIFKAKKLQYDFTSRYLKTRAKFTSSIISIINYLLIAAYVTILLISNLNVIAIGLVAISLIMVPVFEIQSYRKAARRLHQRKLMLSVPIFLLIRPLMNLRYRIIGHKYNVTNFTWQKRKIK